MYLIFLVLQYISTIFPLLLAVAFLTLVERKGLSTIQIRRGPIVVSPFYFRDFLEGFLQPFADAVKLLVKEIVIPVVANKYLFFFAPLLSFFLSLMGWVVIPFGDMFVISDFYLGLLVIFAVSSFGVYAIIIAGWASNSRYALLGALRSSAQMISYELGFGLILLCIGLCVGSLNISDIVYFQEESGWFFWSFMPLAFLFFISVLAETNRVPFDLAEAEAELVSGYNVEYSSAGFVLFFIAEYLNIIFMSSLFVIFFFGGWTSPLFVNIFFFFDLGCFIPWFEPYIFSFKLFIVVVVFIWVRGSLPRYRYDQLMILGWKVLLPVSLIYFVVILVYLFLML